MKHTLKIALLCNNTMALPAMQSLADAGVLCAVATTSRKPDVVHLVRTKANDYGIPYTQVNFQNFDGQLSDWLLVSRPDIVFVMTFPWRIPPHVLAIPKLGFLNFHYGLLPEMRGADPVFESIRQRRKSAGLSIHVMDADFDKGPVILREEIPLPPEYTYGMLCSQMARLGDIKCRQLIDSLLAGNLPSAISQNESLACYWPKIRKEELSVNWQMMDAEAIIALVRACNPIAMGVPVTINGWQFGVCDISEVNLQGDASAIAPGTILAIDAQNGLVVCCRDGKAVRIDVVNAAEGILAGYKLALMGINVGMLFE